MEPQERLTLTVKEAGALLGLSRGLMYEAVKSGQIPSITVGHRILIPKAALDHMLREPITRKYGKSE